MDEDPFLQVQQDVLAQLAATRPLFSSYLRIRSLTTTAAVKSPELASARADLETALASLAEDLADLVESVRAVEGNPAQYGLEAKEVVRRKRLIQDVGGEVEKMRKELAKMTMGGQAQGRGGGGGGTLPDPSAFALTDDNDDDDNGGARDRPDEYEEFEREQQLQLMREQDQNLDNVFQTVGTLRRQADDMGRELEEQREMLEVADDLADRVDGRLQTGMQKLQHVIRRNEDRWSSCCIGALIMVLIILLVLLLVL